MNTKVLLLASAAMLMNLSASAAQDQLLQPIKVTARKQIDKSCNGSFGWSAYLSRSDMARGFGRAWTDDMNTVRVQANHQASDLCWQGYSEVVFTFVAGSDRSMAITAGSRDDKRVAATP
ncbi:MAG: hypothetical protein JF567_10000 [Xanthomonadales bacterium]|nr:hypothetical protein [Xanthomonadales bacterium]